MAIQKQGYNIKYGQGLDLKTDPNQVPAGKFLSLQNTVFDVGGLLKKRNGFSLLTTLPDTTYNNLVTLNSNLVATGKNLSTYSSETNAWVVQGSTRPVDLSVQPLVRSAASQTVCDATVASNGLVCTAYTDSTGSFYQITDGSTGQAVVHATALVSTAVMPRTFVLGSYFIVTYLATISATPHLQYVAIPIANPNSPRTSADISTLVSGLTAGYDGVVSGMSLYIGWKSTAGNLRYTKLSSTLSLFSATTVATHDADLMSLTADESGSNPVIYMSFWDSGSTNGYTTAFNQNLTQVLAPTQFLAGVSIRALTSKANSQLLTLLYENIHNYSFAAVASDFTTKNTVTQAGVVGSSSVLLRSVGIASKMFADTAGTYYCLLNYGQTYQPTYFLCDLSGNVIAKLAYSNGINYVSTEVLPSVSSIVDNVFTVSYLFKDLLVPVNKSQGVANVNGIYAQNGVNLASFDLGIVPQYDSEIARTLHLTGGYLWMFDGFKPVEHGFHVWPEDIKVTTSAAGGNLADQTYFYQVTYEWTDAQGNIHRSAPSVPMIQVTAGGNTSTNTLNIPTLRLTQKTTPNAVRIVIYRWSTAQQNYYQITSIASPTLNNPAVDSITYTDTQADSAILGNELIYTTGGVVENIAAPASSASTLFKSRLFVVDAEDRDLIWYSKQVIQTVPVEFSDVFTTYVAPTAGAQGSTGHITALSALDDKLIIFKHSAIYYIVGTGPDNTGANNDFSEPVFITSTVGCANPNSIVQMPMGLMFQSDKGIWLLGRDLSSKYIGAPVESFNNSLVKSAVCVPGTNQVRFTLENGSVLMYDYYYDQWCSFSGIPGISSTLYQGMHTFLNSLGQVLQETPGSYIDNTKPVLMSYTTAWFKLTDLQGFQRAYYLYLLSNFITPHKISVQLAYDYDVAPKQISIISPDNYSLPYGDDPLYGSTSPYGGPSVVEQHRVFFQKQKCQSFQVIVAEIYDPTFSVPAGAGLTMSGLNIVVGAKGTHPRLPSAKSVG